MSLNDPQWGKRGSGGPPDLDEIWRNVNRRINELFGRKGGSGDDDPAPAAAAAAARCFRSSGAGILVALVLVVWLASGFYIVDEGRRGVVTRFGKYTETTQPGARWHLPYPIEEKELVDFSQVRTVEVGYRNTPKNKKDNEALMLTDDENIIDIQFAVQYNIKNAEANVFNVRKPDLIVQFIAQTAMGEVVGKAKMDFVLYEGREQIAKSAEKLMQEMLDRYQTGVYVQKVTLQSVQPPDKVQAAFDDAVKAGQDRERFRNEGQAYANDVVPRARGNAARLIEEANGYQAEVIQRAEGDASRFRQIQVEYAKAPAVTRERLYLDMMQTVDRQLEQGAGRPEGRQQQPPVPAARPVDPAECRAGRDCDHGRSVGGAPVHAATAGTDRQPRSRPFARGTARPRPRDGTAMKFTIPILALVVALLLVASQSLYTVDQRQYAIKFQLGEIVETLPNAGLYAKVPLLQNVKFYDKRILLLDNPEPDRITTSEKKPLLVDFFVLWRITDVKQYYISVQGDEEVARRRLSQTVRANLAEEFNKRTVHEAISSERDKIMTTTRQKADADAKTIGVEIVDVRLRRVELPPDVTGPVYARMESERRRVANELRSLGQAESEKIRADADRQRVVILADAYKTAQKTKGDGDAKSSAIYAQAYSANPEFYAFYRSLEAYKATFRSKSDVMVLDPNSEFFRYMKNQGGQGAKAPK